MTSYMNERSSEIRKSQDWIFHPAAIVLLGVISLFKGLRIPSRWAATQAAINYDSGLLKRGFFGETIGRWFHFQQFSHFAAGSFVILAVFVALVLFLTLSIVKGRSGCAAVCAVFFSSFAVTFIADMIGYLDIALGILAVSLLLIRGTWLRFFVAIPVSVVALLIHESFLFTLLPVILFSFVLDAATESKPGRSLRAPLMILFLISISSAVTVKLALARPVTPEVAAAMERRLQSSVNFPLRSDVFLTLERSARENFRYMKFMYRSCPGCKTMFSVSAAVFAPTAILLLTAIGAALRLVPETVRHRNILLASAWIACVSPLAMYFLGWDWARWNTLACFDAFVVFLLICRNFPGTPIQLPAWFRGAGILVIVLSMATGEPLMDDQQINTFPFVYALKDAHFESIVPLKVNPPDK